MYPGNENIVHDIKIFSFYVSRCIPICSLSIDSGSSGRTPVGVRVPASAPRKFKGLGSNGLTSFLLGNVLGNIALVASRSDLKR
jgi:hypothetical protein